MASFLFSMASDQSTIKQIKLLHDVTCEVLAGLSNLNIDISTWDAMLLHMLMKKLYSTTHMLYEQTLTNPKDLQRIPGFLEFLEGRFQSMEQLQLKERPRASVVAVGTSQYDMSGTHPLFKCNKFTQSSVQEREQIVKNINVCRNCLRPGHYATQCSKPTCFKSKNKPNLCYIRKSYRQYYQW